MNESQKKMLLDWMRKVHQLEYAHRFESIKWVKVHRWIGYGAFVLSIIIAFSFRFPEVDIKTFDNLPFFLKQNFFVAFASTVVALLTGFQTFLKPNEKAEQHKNTGSNYEKIRHRIEFILTTKFTESERKNRIDLVKDEWENLDAINVSNKNFQKGKNKVKTFGKYPEELAFLEDVEKE
ncbi:SLATT domain-containing protein [Maribacter sp. BPC-D8]|uniref:SLATT domain-containing protein n=1 Tax=Maribacter sp. BPC-D8 TaxID=3053613 RepID=UPI002B467892|nr:SLATT domain-containing protein [Maribacter sp. BPC-D8]WRI28021.1 SLATT domain-containing protein [Maribacter sp. BPC-D8]